MVKAASGGRYIVGVRPKIEKSKLKPGTRVTLDMTTYTIMMILPREVDPTVHNMVAEDPGEIKYGDVGGESIIYSTDKDFFQLACDNIKIYNPVKKKTFSLVVLTHLPVQPC